VQSGQRGGRIRGGRQRFIGQESFTGIAEYYRHGPYKVYAHECRSAGRTPIDLVRVSQPAGSFPDPPLPALSVFLVTRGDIRTRVRLGDRPFVRRQWPGTFLVAPPNTACEYEVSAAHELLVVAVPLAAVVPLLDTAGVTLDDLAPLHADTYRDPFIQQLCLRLFEEASADSPLGSLFADHAVTTLVGALVRLTGLGVSECRQRPAASLRRALDYVNDHLAGPVSLADLAAVAGVSVFHFARQFRGAVGEPPHQYIIRRRVERAKDLMREGRLSLAQVAAAVGFADQSHLARHFKRLVGVTPRQFLGAGG
jgi:AraC family transcriptional regulator